MSSKPRVVFIGSGEIGLPTLQCLANSSLVSLVGIVTQPDKPVGRSQVLTSPAPKRMAIALSLPILQPLKIRRTEELGLIENLSPDLIVVMAYGQILPKALLEMPSLACLNLHASILPRHRGAAPIQAAILAGDQMTGVTVMYMAEGLDTGDILLTRSLPIRRRETAGSLHDRLAKLGPEALAPALDLILSQQAPRIPQDKSQASYAPKLESESGIINWSQDCWHLDRLVRAMDPWPGAFTLVHAADDTVRKLKVHRALPIHRFAGEPGVVIRVGTRGIVVACGNGALLLLEVQLEGKRRMAATEFVRGFALPVGTAFENPKPKIAEDKR
ncbi:MAG TPA: methionyl-tRNA formyltransferase [Chthoniobacterales bacterium]|jgi:methionyl-tRNA formyltransferase|nr:methionyl-tRNA formyltransferase [Chthoniobacterales bacterium]